jgi:hypothetical protein
MHTGQLMQRFTEQGPIGSGVVVDRKKIVLGLKAYARVMIIEWSEGMGRYIEGKIMSLKR